MQRREAQLLVVGRARPVAAAPPVAPRTWATDGTFRSAVRASHAEPLRLARLTRMLTAWKISVAEQARR